MVFTTFYHWLQHARLHVLLEPHFFLWWIGVSLLVLTLDLWLQNLPLIYFIVFESTAPLTSKLILIGNLYGGLMTNFTPLTALTTVFIALLSGFNAGLLALYLQKTKSLRSLPTQSMFVSFGALVSAVFGIGCASCGSIIFMAVLLQLGAGGVLFLLPFHGQEFSLLAVGLLVYSLILLWRKLNAPAVCV